jgi:hypothetical protein
MEATLEIEYLKGSRGERIIKELALVSDDVIQTYHFKPPTYTKRYFFCITKK